KSERHGKSLSSWFRQNSGSSNLRTAALSRRFFGLRITSLGIQTQNQKRCETTAVQTYVCNDVSLPKNNHVHPSERQLHGERVALPFSLQLAGPSGVDLLELVFGANGDGHFLEVFAAVVGDRDDDAAWRINDCHVNRWRILRPRNFFLTPNWR